MVVVAGEDLVNHGRTSRNGQANRCCHCCTSQMTEVDGQLVQQIHLSKYYPNDAWASRILVSYPAGRVEYLGNGLTQDHH